MRAERTRAGFRPNRSERGPTSNTPDAHPTRTQPDTQPFMKSPRPNRAVSGSIAPEMTPVSYPKRRPPNVATRQMGTR